MNNDFSSGTPAAVLPDANSAHDASPEVVKYITFKLSDYLFALPGEKILKIVTTPSPSEGGLVSMGLVQLAQYSIQILDLPNLLSLEQAHQDVDSEKDSDKAAALSEESHSLVNDSSAENPPFLMVLQNADQDLLGIAVNEPPDLMDIPTYALKPVPPEKRMTRTLRWVSHVVTYDLGSDRHTLLILDLSVLLASQRVEEPPSEPNVFAIEPPMEAESETARQEEMYA